MLENLAICYTRLYDLDYVMTYDVSRVSLRFLYCILLHHVTLRSSLPFYAHVVLWCAIYTIACYSMLCYVLLCIL